MPGTSESTVIRTKLLVKSAFCTSLSLLKFSTILKLEALASGLFENRMNLVFSGCSASLKNLKWSTTFLNYLLNQLIEVLARQK